MVFVRAGNYDGIECFFCQEVFHACIRIRDFPLLCKFTRVIQVSPNNGAHIGGFVAGVILIKLMAAGRSRPAYA